MTRARTMHPLALTRSIVLLVIGLVILPASIAGAQTNTTPKDPATEQWLGVVTEDGIAIRSGRAPEFYAIGTLKKGDFVMVRAAHQHADWYTIDVPNGITGFVSARNLEVDASGKRGSTVGRTRVLYPREDNPALSWRGHPLFAGTEMRLLELITTETKGDFFRVEMPDAVGAYVVAKFVRKATPEERRAWAQANVEEAAQDAADPVTTPVDEVATDIARGVEDATEAIEEAADTVQDAVTNTVTDAVANTTTNTPVSTPDVETTLPSETPDANPVPIETVQPSDENTSRLWTPEAIEEQTTPADASTETTDDAPAEDTTVVYVDATIVAPNEGGGEGADDDEAAAAGAADPPANAGRRKPIRPQSSGPEAIRTRPESVEPLMHELTPPPADGTLPDAVRAHNDADLPTFDTDEPPTIASLDEAYASMLRQPVLDREIEPLLREFEARLDAGDLNVHEERLVRMRVKLLELQLERQAFNRKVEARMADAQSSVASIETLENEIADTSRTEFTGVLRLSAVYDGKRLPRLYRLVDPMRRGSIIYVQPVEGVDLAGWIDTPVTIRGVQEELGGYAIRVLVPATVQPR